MLTMTLRNVWQNVQAQRMAQIILISVCKCVRLVNMDKTTLECVCSPVLQAPLLTTTLEFAFWLAQLLQIYMGKMSIIHASKYVHQILTTMQIIPREGAFPHVRSANQHLLIDWHEDVFWHAPYLISHMLTILLGLVSPSAITMARTSPMLIIRL